MKFNYWQKLEPGVFYHIYNRGINNETIFKTDENMQFFLRRWKDLISPYLDVAAFCLMPNHFHFLVRVKPLTEEVLFFVQKEGTVKSEKLVHGQIAYNDFLEDQLKRLFQSFALAINKQQQRSGSIFQKRFKRVLVTSMDKLWYLLAYIHHNPIHHGFRLKYEDWEFSSYKAYLSERPTLVIREEVLGWYEPDFTPDERTPDIRTPDARLLNLRGLVNVGTSDNVGTPDVRLPNLRGLGNVGTSDNVGTPDIRLPNLRGLVNEEASLRAGKISAFLKHHKEFRLDNTEMRSYYLDEES